MKRWFITLATLVVFSLIHSVRSEDQGYDRFPMAGDADSTVCIDFYSGDSVKWSICRTGDSLQIKDSLGAVVMAFKQGAQVGIGTSNPSAMFDVQSGTQTPTIAISTTDATYDPTINFRSGATPATKFSLKYDTGDDAMFLLDSVDRGLKWQSVGGVFENIGVLAHNFTELGQKDVWVSIVTPLDVTSGAQQRRLMWGYAPNANYLSPNAHTFYFADFWDAAAPGVGLDIRGSTSPAFVPTVGIGTITGTRTLNLNAQYGANLGFRANNVEGAYIELLDDKTFGIYGTTGSYLYIAYNTSAAPLVRCINDAVGINMNPVNTLDVSGTIGATGAISCASLTLTSTLTVANGGTGAATLTDHGILLGSGTDAITALGAATDGQLPIGSTGADPVLATLTGTSNQVTVTNGAGTITLSTPQDIHTAANPQFAGLKIGAAAFSGSELVRVYRNDASTSPNVLLEQDATGDATLSWLLTGGDQYTMGIDNDDGDVLKLVYGASLSGDFFSMNSVGHIAIGASPSTSYLSVFDYRPADVNSHNAQRILFYPSISSGTVAAGGYGSYCVASPSIPAGATNSGVLVALGGLATNGSSGTANDIRALFYSYGKTGGAGSIVNSSGIWLYPRRAKGTGGSITSQYDIYIQAPDAGGAACAVTNDYCIYSDHNATSHFSGALAVASNAGGLILGSGYDTDIKFNGANLQYDTKLSGGQHEFRGGNLRTDDARYRRYYHISLGSFDPGASGATWTDADANTLCGWQLDATGETLESSTDVHNDWDAASDLTLEVKFTVNVDNTGGAAEDVVDFVIDVWYKGAGDVATKSQTITESVTVGACAQWTQFSHNFTIDYNPASNVVERGDVMCFSMHIVTATGDVNDITVNGASYSYNTTHVGIESGDI